MPYLHCWQTNIKINESLIKYLLVKLKKGQYSGKCLHPFLNYFTFKQIDTLQLTMIDKCVQNLTSQFDVIPFMLCLKEKKHTLCSLQPHFGTKSVVS